MDEETEQQSNQVAGWVGGVVAVTAILGFMWWLYGDLATFLLFSSEEEAAAERAAEERAEAPDWYEGATLQDKTMSEWREASPHNRLATSAFVVFKGMERQGEKPSSMEEIRHEAEELRDCVNEAGKGGAADSEDVATIAASCWIMSEG